MTKDRKVNIIRALKHEIRCYKKLLIPTNTVDRTELQHFVLDTAYLPREVAQMPKDELPKLMIHRMTDAFKDFIMQMPIETEFDEEFNAYRATLDIWVKQNRRY